MATVISEVLKEIDVKEKQMEAILTFLSGCDKFVMLPTINLHLACHHTGGTTHQPERAEMRAHEKKEEDAAAASEAKVGHSSQHTSHALGQSIPVAGGQLLLVSFLLLHRMRRQLT